MPNEKLQSDIERLAAAPDHRGASHGMPSAFPNVASYRWGATGRTTTAVP